jgi:hypothetical protein
LKSKDSRLFLIFWLCAILGSYVPICTRYFRKCGNECSLPYHSFDTLPFFKCALQTSN